MGTQVQTKMHLPGYHSTRDLNDTTKTLNNGHYHNLFSTKPSPDSFLEHGKDTLRQTILKHETVFRHQVLELHRLYKKQKDLMNGIKTSELQNESGPVDTSQSIFSSPSAQPANELKRWHASAFPTASYCARPPKPGTDAIHSHFDMEEKIMQSSRDCSQDAEAMKDCELLESKFKKPKKLLIDLELPADEYICSEEEDLRISAAPRVESRWRDEKLSCGRSLTFDRQSGSSNSKLYLGRTYGLTNSNKPTSAFVHVPTQSNVSASKEDEQRWSQSAFPYLGKELPNFQRGRDEVISTLHLQNDRNKRECLTYLSEHGRTSTYRNNLYGSLDLENRRTSLDSSLVQNSVTNEHAAVFPPDQRKVEHRNKETIFGVGISDRDQNAHVVASHAVGLYSPSSHSDFANSDTFLVSTQSRRPSALNQLSSAEGHHCSNSKMLMSSHDFTRSLLWDSKPNPSSLEFQLATSKELHACRQPSIGFGSRNGTNGNHSAYEPFSKYGQGIYYRGSECLKDTKSIKDVGADVVSSNRCRNEALSEHSFGPNDMQRKHENPQGGLSWLRNMMLLKSEASEEKKDCSDLGMFQMGQFANGTGPRKSASHGLRQDFSTGTHDQDCVLKDPPSDISSTKPNCLLPAAGSVNSLKLELFEIDNSQPREQRNAAGHGLNKGLVAHNTDFRYQIDLNICMTEEAEEAQLRPSSPKIDVNISAEINLEMAVVGAEIDTTPDCESPEIILKGPPHEVHIRDAAEALVAISSSRAHNLEGDAIRNRSEASSLDSLIWFAEIASEHKDNIENELETTLEQCPDGMDYFELMTLRLAETKVEEYHIEPHDQPRAQAQEECKDENASTKRPKRVQTKRARQRRDFQRETLPGLVTLSRHEVTEDLQIIEALVGATGGTWQASLTRRNAANGSRRRGRRNSGNSVTSPKPSAPAGEGKSLMSWGKRTRRLPRQRCSNLISKVTVFR